MIKAVVEVIALGLCGRFIALVLCGRDTQTVILGRIITVLVFCCGKAMISEHCGGDVEFMFARNPFKKLGPRGKVKVSRSVTAAKINLEPKMSDNVEAHGGRCDGYAITQPFRQEPGFGNITEDIIVNLALPVIVLELA
ncbi:hypothetical protein GGX14DRAFT_390417 [Mycena pura]|uniref:Uncharacterized protein n=1 Tax=Mycena pura TaxID=153505 RepID=A0AAD6VQD3_9AGAR|nr:hypothetical protein GGX14DRAFT_390417 [Mycena pura]